MSRSHGGNRQYKPLLTVQPSTFFLLPSPPLSFGVLAVLDAFRLPVPCKTTFRHHSAVGQPVRLLDPGDGRNDHPSIHFLDEREVGSTAPLAFFKPVFPPLFHPQEFSSFLLPGRAPERLASNPTNHTTDRKRWLSWFTPRRRMSTSTRLDVHGERRHIRHLPTTEPLSG